MIYNEEENGEEKHKSILLVSDNNYLNNSQEFLMN